MEVAEAEYVASLIPDANLVIRPGTRDADLAGFSDTVRDFLGVDREPGIETILSTVLFTDIVGSTAKQAELGDHGGKHSSSVIICWSVEPSGDGVAWRTTRPAMASSRRSTAPPARSDVR